MKPIQFIKEVHSALLSVGIDAKLSFSGKGAKIETSFGDANIKWQRTEGGFVLDDLDKLIFVTDATHIISDMAKGTSNYLFGLLNKELKETSKKQDDEV